MKQRLLSLFVLLVLLGSCETQPASRRDLLPGYIGRSGEILVVMDKRYWDTQCGEAIRDKIHQPYQVLNQYEHLFDIQYRNLADFSKFFKPFRTIIYAKIGDVLDNQKARVEVSEEEFAKDQIIFHVHAKSPEEFIGTFNKHAEQITERIHKEELKRFRYAVRAVKSASIDKELRSKYGIGIDVHRDFQVYETREDFIWMRRQQFRPENGINHDVEQGIMIYTYPYENDSTFTRSFLLQKRDSVLKSNVPGGPEGSYMTTEYFYDPVFEDSRLGDAYASKLRGLWTVEGDYLGGPFISLTTLDPARNRIVTVEGYVYAPNFDKREYIRELEAILHTIKFTQPTTK